MNKQELVQEKPSAEDILGSVGAIVLIFVIGVLILLGGCTLLAMIVLGTICYAIFYGLRWALPRACRPFRFMTLRFSLPN